MMITDMDVLDPAPRDVNAVMYSKDNCPFCDRALDALNDAELVVRVFKLGQDFERDELFALVEQRTGQVVETVPQIFIEGQYIGGYDDLVRHLELVTTLGDDTLDWFEDEDL
jgi:glutaredoxin 3